MILKDFFSKQARKPTGLFGPMIMSPIFEKGNADLNFLMKDQLEKKELSEEVFRLYALILHCAVAVSRPFSKLF